MKNYRAWILVISVIAMLLGSSALYPWDSQANRFDAPSPGIDPHEIIPLFPPQSAAQSQTGILSSSPASYTGSLALNVARKGHTATALGDGRVAIIGGQNQSGPVGDVEVFDPRAQSMQTVATLKAPRSRHTATLLADGRVLVAGGWNQKERFDSTEIFNPQTNSFTRGPRLHTPRAAHSATMLQDGRILLAGGNPDASAEMYDPATGQTARVRASMTAARNFQATALLADGNVLIVGGIDAEGRALRSAEVFDVRTQTFLPTAPMRIKRVRATLRRLPDGKVQVIGGDGDGTMEVYDPAQNQFGAAAHLTPTAGIVPTAKILQSPMRAAFIDSKMTLEGSISDQSTKPVQHYSTAIKRSLDDFDALLERADYAAAEIKDDNRAVVAGGVGPGGVYVSSLIVTENSPATITTDKVVYLPGERPYLSGSGWQPHEAITVVRQEARPTHLRKYIQVVADDLGNFAVSDPIFADFQQAMTYTLTAMGERSARVAQTTYGDVRLEKPKAEDVKFDIPVLFRDASFEHKAGMLVWTMTSGNGNSAKPPELPIQIPSDVNNFDLSQVIDQPCLGLSSCPLPSAFDIQMKSGSSITLDSGISFDGANLKITEKLYGKIILDVTGNGSIDLPAFGIPGASIGFMISLGDIVDIDVSFGVKVKPSIEFTDPGTTIRVTLGLGDSANPGQSITIQIPNTPTVDGSLNPTIDFKLVDTHGGCLKIAIGPELSISGGVGPESCQFGASAEMFVGPFVKGCFNISGFGTSCPTYEIPISVGLQADVAGAIKLCTEFGTSYSADLFETVIHTFTGNLGDTIPPTISVPTSFTQGTDTDQCGAKVSFTPTASDGDCPTPTIVCTPASGSFFQKGTTDVTCVATDGGGNTANGSFMVTVNDTQKPTVTVPSPITQANDTDQCSAVVTYSASANDNCDGSLTPSCVPASGSAFQKGVTTVTCTATDAASNTNSNSFTVTVNDTQKPTISQSNITQGTDSNQCGAVVTFTPTISDNCDKGLSPACSPPSGSTFPKGTTDVTCTVTDRSNNQSLPVSFTVTINDTQGPIISTPASVTQGTDPNLCSAVVSYTATANDNCDGPVTPTCAPPSGSVFQKGVTTVTCTAKDAANNPSTKAFTVTVNDTQKPAITCPADITAVTTQSGGACATVSFAPTSVMDNCPGVTYACVPPSGSCFAAGTTTVTCTATDTSSNQSSCAFLVNVFNVRLQDDSNPTIVLLWNSFSGAYRFCTPGAQFSGVGAVRRQGSIYTLDLQGPDRRITATCDGGAFRGSASLQSPPAGLKAAIADRDIRNNTMICQ